MEVRIDVVRGCSVELYLQHVVCIPGHVILWSKLQATQDADRVGCSWVNRLGLCDEAEGNCQFVAIDRRGVQLEEFVCQPDIRSIDRQTIWNRDLQCAGCERRDPLCKLQHEIPSGTAFLIATR